MPSPLRKLPIYPSPVTSARGEPPLTPERAKALRETERSLGLSVGDMTPVELDDHIAFSCNRSGACCQGRQPLSNLVMPGEAAYMWQVLQQRGMRDIKDFVPDTLLRLVTINSRPPRGVRKNELSQRAPRSRDEPAVGQFGGLMFRMSDDPSMPDGDRCQFLLGQKPGEYACAWHRTRGQPLACALAPVGIVEIESEILFAIPKSRYSWCQGTQEMIDSGAKGFTLRELLARNHGDERLLDARAFTEASLATAAWKRGFQNHHSPLARLYISKIPELEGVLAGY